MTIVAHRSSPVGSLAVVEPAAADWDAFTSSHPRGHLLQSSGWGALKQHIGWEARRVLVVGPDGPRAGAQVLIRRRFGLSVVYVPRGPLFAGDAQADVVLLAALDRLARRSRAVFLRLEPNLLERDAAAGELHSALLLAEFVPAPPLQPRSTLQLDLAPDADRLLAAMSKGHRADIRRAAREGVVVRAGTSAADLDAFFVLMEQTGTRAGFGIHSRDYYRVAWQQFRGAGAAPGALLLLAEREGVALAACLIFGWAGAGLYLYGGSTEEGLKRGANHALQWHAIQWARAAGCRLYDFWGVPDELGQAEDAADEAERARLEAAAKLDPLYGVFRFKKGFGGRVVRYLPAYDRVYMRPLYALWQRRMQS
jgi:lipid II:glycine glycyltransferase (peptidoglycan interpeptide bridge formation enzyme)